MASTKKPLAPAVSAGKRNKVTFRNMILCAVQQLHKKGTASNFGSISDFIFDSYKIRNDFIIEKELEHLVKSGVIQKSGGSFHMKGAKKNSKKGKKRKSRIKRSVKRRKKLKKRKATKRRRTRKKRSGKKKKKTKRSLC